MNSADETNGCFEKQTPNSKKWGDVRTFNFHRIEKYVRGFLDEDGIAIKNVYVIGFSLGAVMALYSGMSLSERNLPIGGVEARPDAVHGEQVLDGRRP